MANGADKALLHNEMMEESKIKSDTKPNLRKDRGNIAVLVFLYVLQGIPLGLAGAMPMLLQARKVAYKEQATFSLVFWPFSMKLLWAPIVDTVYLSSFGRRKTWLVPVQYLIGIFMLVLSTVSTECGNLWQILIDILQSNFATKTRGCSPTLIDKTLSYALIKNIEEQINK